jgi:hypothetical protein
VPDGLGRVVVRPLARRWLSNSRSSWRSLAFPGAVGRVSAPGIDPDRILLLGGGITVGWGMNSHEDALGGHLARAISAATGRGVIMDVVADDILAGVPALPASILRLLRTVDAVVITPGDVDAILGLPAAIYRRRLEKVIDQITETAPANVRIFIVATVPLDTVVTLPRAVRSLASRLGAALDEKARRLCQERHNSIFVPFSPIGVAGREGTGRTYAAWAGLIAPPVARQLDSCTDRPIR